jgi:exopolyphosphatase / guanosine-5'-triphosphate,3'-diphosphate pyrophosphatase
METVRRAVIDVGTNSAKLLVADVRGSDVQPVLEESRQTRLGAGFYESHQLQPEPIARTAEAVWEFAEIAREKSASSIRVIATSAARDAVNPADLTNTIERACGLKTEIISGEREAEWAFQGVATDPKLVNTSLLLLDVGGGSTEFILGRDGQKLFAGSFPFGTVRLLEQFRLSDPPTRSEFAACRDWLQSFLRAELRPPLEPVLAGETGELRLVGTGGTASILASIAKKLDRFDRDQIEHSVLTLKEVITQRKHLWRICLEERKDVPGLPRQRADVILTGVLIYEAVMAELGFGTLHISTRGLRFAAVMD